MNLKESIKIVLKEWTAKIDREEKLGISYKSLEMVLNKTMSKKYDWWNEIKISEILYSEFSNTIEIYGKIYANKNWVKKSWKENRGYKLPEDEKYIRLDDIVDSLYEKELSDNITPIFRAVTNYRTAEKTRLGWNQIIPV